MPKETPAKLVERLRAWALEHGYSQSDLARMLRVTRTSVSEWFHDSVWPDGERVLRIQRLLRARDLPPKKRGKHGKVEPVKPVVSKFLSAAVKHFHRVQSCKPVVPVKAKSAAIAVEPEQVTPVLAFALAVWEKNRHLEAPAKPVPAKSAEQLAAMQAPEENSLDLDLSFW